MRQRKGLPSLSNQSDKRRTGASPIASRQGLVGVLAQDPAGRVFSIPFAATGNVGGMGSVPTSIPTTDYVGAAVGVVAAFYMSPLVTGVDPTTSELIFAPNGDVVMVPVYY